MDIVAVIDFETTGLSPEQGDRATEVAVVIVENGRIRDRYQSLLNAGVRIPPFVESLTGISNDMVKRAPPAERVIRELFSFVSDIPLVAHNASFDRKFFDAELSRVGKRRLQDFVCSMRVARRVYPDAPNHKLGTLVKFAGVPLAGRAHRALADAEMTANLWLKMREELCRRNRLRDVPLDLMSCLQGVPKSKADQYVSKYKLTHGI